MNSKHRLFFSVLFVSICVAIIPASALQQQNLPPPAAPGKLQASPNNAVKNGDDTIGPSRSCPATVVPSTIPAIRRQAVNALRKRSLLFPIAGVNPESIKGSFYSMHGCSMHEAADIMAAIGTPVHAVDNGTIAKLFLSKAGGITVYQYAPTRQYVYYYAHLLKYAENLKEGQSVSKGDVLAYVDTTGNAPKNAPHLHFSITMLGKGQGWWQGSPSIDPYEVFKR